MILHDIASEQLLKHITVSLLRTHAYGLLQCHLFILHPPKAHLHLIQMQPKFSLLASQTRHQFCHRGMLCFHRSAHYRSLLEFLILRAQLVSVISFAIPLPNPSSLESCTTQVTVQQGRQSRRVLTTHATEHCVQSITIVGLGNVIYHGIHGPYIWIVERPSEVHASSFDQSSHPDYHVPGAA